MASYKVIQDIEAEDKLVGPLTLRQFIYAGVAAVCLYICFLSLTKGFGFVIVIFLPIAAVAGFFGFPWKGEQPTEIWALARLRYNLKPRVRIWDQDGVKDMVTITVPKKLDTKHSSKDDLSQDQVRSRLKALADTIDSRGWATRNAAYGIYGQQWAHPSLAPLPVPAANNNLASMLPSDDMFDSRSSVSQNFDAMLNKSQVDQRQRLMQQMNQAANGEPYQMPQLPRPLNANVLPNIPTPNAASAYDVAPASAPMPIAAQPPQQAAPYPQPYPMQQQQQPYQQPAYQPQPMPQMPPPVQQYVPPALPQLPVYSQPAPAAATNDTWFTNGPAYPSMPPPTPMRQTPPTADARIESDMPLATAATPTSEDDALGQSIKQQNQAAMAINYNHMRVLQPAGSEQYASTLPMGMPAPTVPAEPVTRTPDPAILELANNDDLDIATIARQAKREIDKSPDEVEIRLH